MKGIVLVFFFFSLSPASAQYFKYSDIASSPPADQNMYIAGVADALAEEHLASTFVLEKRFE